MSDGPAGGKPPALLYSRRMPWYNGKNSIGYEALDGAEADVLRLYRVKGGICS